MLRDFIDSYDIKGLTNADKDELVNEMEWVLAKDTDIEEHIYRNREELTSNVKVSAYFNGRVFAGRKTIRWSKLKIDNIEQANAKFENHDVYNKYIIPALEEQVGVKLISCIKKARNDYYLKHIVYGKLVKKASFTGFIHTREEQVVFSKINTQSGVLEVRAGEKVAKKILAETTKMLGLGSDKILAFKVLGRYGADIVRLKEALPNACFLNQTAKTKIKVELDDNQRNYIVNMFIALDNYVRTKDQEALISSLEDGCDVIEDIGIMNYLLAGTSTFGLSTPENEEDLTCQPFYKSSKDYVNCSYGILSFDYEGNRHVIKVGVESNTIQFYTPSNESVIEMLKGLLL